MGYGYSGRGIYKNVPADDNLLDEGPIPAGFYDIGTPRDTDTHGPFVLPLTPHPSNQMFGRGGFLIHGDSVSNPGCASLGCIVTSPVVRHEIAASGDTLLHVIP